MKHLRSMAICIGVAIIVAPASAQVIDLGKLMNLPRNARDAQRNGQQQSEAERCRTLKDWVSAVPAGNATRRTDDMTPFIEDALFSKYFAKTYDQLTPEELRQTQILLPSCLRQNILTPQQQQAAQGIWNPFMHPRLSKQLTTARDQRTEFAALSQELEQLQPNDSDFRRIESIAKRAAIAGRAASADERAAFQSKVDGTRTRMGLVIYRERVSQTLKDSTGSPGLLAVVRLHDEVGQARLPVVQTQDFRRELADRAAELAPAVAKSEAAQLPAPLTGLAGLESSLAWVIDFDRRYSSVLSLALPLADLRREVISARSKDIEAHQSTLLGLVGTANSAQEVNAALQRTLLPEEQQGVARVIKDAASERMALVQRVQGDQQVFGVQPEHAALLSGTVATALSAPPKPAASMANKCDQLAAHPNDPERISAGIADESLQVKAALAACTDAVKQQPQLGRIQFQHGRALLESKRIAEAIAAFQRAATLNHGGAYAYLSGAYEAGGNGLTKSQARSEEFAKKAQQLGFVSGAPSRAAAARDAGRPVLVESKELALYEDVNLLQAVYFGQASKLNNEVSYTQAYLLAQVELLASECQSFKLTELREYQSGVLRANTPRNENELARLGWQQLANTMTLLANASRNPQTMIDAGARAQRIQDAPNYGQKDLVLFVTKYGGCGAPVLERYTGNLRHYFSAGRHATR